MLQIYQQKDSNLSSKIRKQANKLYKDLLDFDPEKYLNILNEYSKSLALAPKQADEFVLALSNRSAVLLKFFKYENCLIDVDAALQFSKDHALRFKLLSRKIECLINLNESTDKIKECFYNAQQEANLLDKKSTNVCLEKLASIYRKDKKNFTRKLKNDNNVSNFISPAISWNYNEKFGNHLFANKDINVGEKLIIEDFYCGFPEIDKLHIICSYCLSVTLNSIPCESCTQAVFCSDKCQKLAWEKFHDIECDIYQGLLKDVHSSFLKRNHLTMLRLFLIALKETGCLKNLIDKVNEIDNTREKYKTIFTDVLVKKEHKSFDFIFGLAKVNRNFIQGSFNFNEEVSKLFIMNIVKSKYFSNQDVMKNVDSLKLVLISLLNTINANNFGALQYYCQDKMGVCRFKSGTVLMPTSSLINHSCKPNCAYMYTKNSKLMLYAETPIKKNEQLFISYDNGTESVQKRQSILLESYGFKCECIACIENWEVYSLPEDFKIIKLKHESIYEFYESIREGTSSFRKEFNRVGDSKKLGDLLCKMIEKGYLSLSKYDADLALKNVKNDLRLLYKKLYAKEIFDTNFYHLY